MKRKLMIVILFVLLVATFSLPASADTSASSYVIVGAGNQLPAGLATKINNAGGTITRSIPQIGVAFASSSNADFATNAAGIAGVQYAVADMNLQWVNPTYQVEADFGNPPNSGDDDFFFDLQWGHDAIDAPEAWDNGYRGAGVRVAVLDTGFDLDHPDLAPNINLALSADFTGEGLQYTIPDPFSHGTHTAGTVAAADNAFGTIGVAPEAELVLVKVLRDSGSGTFEGVIAGIVHAADVDADVINMSLSATIPHSAQGAAGLFVALGRATTYAYQHGTTVIAAASNAATDLDHDADFKVIPAESPNVIAISATAPIGWATDPANTFLDNLASYSNYGQSAVHFAAPGGDFIYPGNESCTVAGLTRPCWVFDLVFSTGNSGWYWSAGTSMASPHAAGVAALIIGANGGDMSPAQVEAALLQTADDLGKPGNDDAYGNGRVNAGNID